LIRNRYFEGKDLTVGGLTAEQDYFNNKRRLLNLASFGRGVVFGMTATKLSGRSVVIESGLAIDALGREIVIGKQAVVNLSDLDGFDDDDGTQSAVYLCIEYAEQGRSPVHSMTDLATADDLYSMTEEGYRLFLSYGEPDEEMLGLGRAAGGEDGAGGAGGLEAAHVAEGVTREYRSESLDERLTAGVQYRLYIARLRIVRWIEAYEIDEITPVPFGQYAASADLLSKLLDSMEPPGGPGMVGDAGTSTPATRPADEPNEPVQKDCASGSVAIAVPEGTVPNTVVLSREVAHGLGLVCVSMSLALETEEGTISGSEGVFPESRQYEFAVRTNEKAGTFRVGVKIKTAAPAPMLTLRWRAEVDQGAAPAPDEDPRIVITPGAPVLKVRQSQQFTARVYGSDDTEVVWGTPDPSHGDIMRDGYYTAPNAPGVYEVIAFLPDDMEVKSIAVVTVKEYTRP
jgi:hypothetical protein